MSASTDDTAKLRELSATFRAERTNPALRLPWVGGFKAISRQVGGHRVWKNFPRRWAAAKCTSPSSSGMFRPRPAITGPFSVGGRVQGEIHLGRPLKAVNERCEKSYQYLKQFGPVLGRSHRWATPPLQGAVSGEPDRRHGGGGNRWTARGAGRVRAAEMSRRAFLQGRRRRGEGTLGSSRRRAVQRGEGGTAGPTGGEIRLGKPAGWPWKQTPPCRTGPSFKSCTTPGMTTSRHPFHHFQLSITRRKRSSPRGLAACCAHST